MTDEPLPLSTVGRARVTAMMAVTKASNFQSILVLPSNCITVCFHHFIHLLPLILIIYDRMSSLPAIDLSV